MLKVVAELQAVIAWIIALIEVALVFLVVFWCGWLHNKSTTAQIEQKARKRKSRNGDYPGKYWW